MSGSRKKKPAAAPAAAAAPAESRAPQHNIASDAAVVLSCLVDGDNMDAPDVVECRDRLALHREGRKVPGYPTRVEPAEYVPRPRRKVVLS